MGVARQLLLLQEVDLELESNEQSLARATSQIGESPAVINTRQELEREEKRLEELRHQQQSAEWEIDDYTVKLAQIEEKLYSGRINNPKELTNLQHETDILKNQRNRLEDKALEIMDQVEQATKNIASINSELKTLEAEWASQQKELQADLERLKVTLTDLNNNRQLLAAEIEPQAISIYQETKKHKGTAVARVEQGICRGCRILLPVSELQRTKGGSLVLCSSCRRILFLA